MKGSKKTNSEYIVDTLLTGKPLRSPEITAMTAEATGKDIKIQDVASILAKLSNSDKCDLGYLVIKNKSERGYAYSLAKEALSLSPEQVYDLTRKTGKDRFTLQEAIKKVPALKKYVRRAGKRPMVRGKQGAAKPAATKPGTRISDEAFKGVVADFLKTVTDQGGLNINVTLNVQFKGIGG